MNKLNNTEALQITTVIPTMKKSLLALAVAGTMAMSGGVYAATEIGATATTATDSAGLEETTELAVAVTHAITVDTSNLTLGANTTEGLTFAAAATGTSLTVTISDSSSATAVSSVIFAGDIVNADAADIIINQTTANATLQGNVTASGAGVVTYTLGNDDTATTLTIDNAFAEDLVLATTINAEDATNNATVTLALTNSEGTAANEITVSGIVGGSNALDAITIGTGVDATFSAAVSATTITLNSVSANTTFGGSDTTANINMAVDGFLTFANDADISGNVDNTTGADGAGTLSLATGAAAMTITGTIGATNSLKDFNIVTGNDGGASATISGAVKAATITITGTVDNDDEVTFQGDVTGNIAIVTGALITVEADKGITGNVTTTDQDGILTFETATANTTLVSGTIATAAADLKVLNVATGADVTSTFGGAIAAVTTNITGTGTVAFTDDLTGALELNTAATATFAANKKVVGTIDTDSLASEGTVTFTATTADTTLVSGAVGDTLALTAVNVAPATGVTATFGGAYDVLTTIHSGAGTMAVTGALGAGQASDINISGGGLVTLGATAGGGAASDVDNTGTTGTGTLTLAAGIDFTGNIGATAPLATLAIDSTGDSTITGTVAATNINLAGTGTTAFTDNDVAGIVNFTADGTATVTADEKIVGSVTTETTNTGTLTFSTTANATTLVSGNIGASGKLLTAVTFDAASGVTATVGGDVYATTINIDGSDDTGIVTISGNITGDTLAINAAGAVVNIAANKNITAATTVGADSKATLNFAGGNTITGLVGVIGGNDVKVINIDGGIVTFANNIAADTVTIDTATTFKTSAAVSINANVTIDNSGTMDLAGTLTLAAEDAAVVDFGAHATTSKMTLVKASAYTSDVVIDTTDTDVTANAANAIEVTPHATFISGTLTLVDTDSNGGSVDDLAKWTFVDNSLATYADSLGAAGATTAGDVIVTATSKTDAVIASALSITTNQAAALKIAAGQVNGTASSASAFDTAMKAGGTTATNAAEKITPDVGAANGAALAAIGGVNNVIAGRQANTRVAFNTLGKQSGVSTGDEANDAVVWAQIFGSTATQDKVATVDGYEADSTGLALGWEADKSGDLMGLSVSYSDADVDGKSASASHTDTTAVQVAAYGTYGKATDWMVGYASADNDTKRTTLDGTASGKYDSTIFSAKVGHAFASSNTGTWTMTPKVDASYTNVDNDGYTETGANAFNLIVASSSNDILTARAGAEFTQRIVDGDAVTIPHVNIMAGYDLTNDGASTTSTFTGGGAAFTTTAADPEKASLQLGFGVDHVSDDSTVSLDLNADLRSDYDSMSGSITFKSKF